MVNTQAMVSQHILKETWILFFPYQASQILLTISIACSEELSNQTWMTMCFTGDVS